MTFESSFVCAVILAASCSNVRWAFRHFSWLPFSTMYIECLTVLCGPSGVSVANLQLLSVQCLLQLLSVQYPSCSAQCLLQLLRGVLCQHIS